MADFPEVRPTRMPAPPRPVIYTLQPGGEHAASPVPPVGDHQLVESAPRPGAHVTLGATPEEDVIAPLEGSAAWGGSHVASVRPGDNGSAHADR